jgi:acyl carrier protein
MIERKREEDFLDAITQSVVRVLGNNQIKVSMDMLFKRDLDLSSLDIVDVGFELEQITGLRVRLLEVFLEQETKGIQNAHDVHIRDIAKYLVQLSEKK